MPSVLNLKKSNCKNCHRCIRKCPVKSIRFTGHQAHIISDECILCGQCFVVCPQEAKEIIDDRERVGVMLQGKAPVIASFDPVLLCLLGGLRSKLRAQGTYRAWLYRRRGDRHRRDDSQARIRADAARGKAGCYHNLGLCVA